MPPSNNSDVHSHRSSGAGTALLRVRRRRDRALRRRRRGAHDGQLLWWHARRVLQVARGTSMQMRVHPSIRARMPAWRAFGGAISKDEAKREKRVASSQVPHRARRHHPIVALRDTARGRGLDARRLRPGEQQRRRRRDGGGRRLVGDVGGGPRRRGRARRRARGHPRGVHCREAEQHASTRRTSSFSLGKQASPNQVAPVDSMQSAATTSSASSTSSLAMSSS